MKLSAKFQRGMSLIEIVLVVVAVSFLVLLIGNLPSAISSVTRSNHSSLARDIAAKKVSLLRQVTYQNLALGSSSFLDVKLKDLPSGTGTFEVNPCPPQVCTLNEQIKLVKVVVSWKEQGDLKNVELTTLVGRGGLGQ